MLSSKTKSRSRSSSKDNEPEKEAEGIIAKMKDNFDDALSSFNLKYDLKKGRTYRELNEIIKEKEKKERNIVSDNFDYKKKYDVSYKTVLLYDDSPSDFDLKKYLGDAVLQKIKDSLENANTIDILKLKPRILKFVDNKIKSIIHIFQHIKEAEDILLELKKAEKESTKKIQRDLLIEIQRGKKIVQISSFPDDITLLKGSNNTSSSKSIDSSSKSIDSSSKSIDSSSKSIDSFIDDFDPIVAKAKAEEEARKAAEEEADAARKAAEEAVKEAEKIRLAVEEATKKAEAARLAAEKAEKDRQAAEEEATRQAELEKQVELARQIELARQAEELARQAEEDAKQEATRQIELAKKAAEDAEAARKAAEDAEAARKAAEPVADLLTDFVVDILDHIRPQQSTSFDADGLLQIVASVEEKTSVPIDNLPDILQTISTIEEEPIPEFDIADVLQILPSVAEKSDEKTVFGDLLQIIGSVSEAVAEFDSDFIIDILDKVKPQISQHFDVDGLLQLIPTIEDKTSVSVDNLPDILATIADVEEIPDEPFVLDDIFSMLADVEEDKPTLETDFIIDILDKIKPQISQHFDIDGLLQIIPNIEEKISESTDNFPDILATIADIREQHSKPFMVDGLLELLPNITGPKDKQVEPLEFSDLLQVIGSVEEVVAEFDSDFIIDILDKIKPQVSQHFDINGLLETIAAVEEQTSVPVDNFPDILATIAAVEEEPNEPFLLDGLFSLLADIDEQRPDLESDFIIDILDKIQPQLAKPVDFNGLLSVIGEIEEDNCERDLKACKEKNKQLLDELHKAQNGILPPLHNEPYDIDMNNGVLEVVSNIDTSDKVIDESDVDGILEVIGNIGVSDKVLDEADFGGILELLSSVNEEEVGEGKDGKSLKACKVIEYVNADGEKETLYPFALIQGRCYYYNKNRDILNDNLEIV